MAKSSVDYGVRIKIDTDKAMKDVGNLLTRLEELKKKAEELKINSSSTSSPSVIQREISSAITSAYKVIEQEREAKEAIKQRRTEAMKAAKAAQDASRRTREALARDMATIARAAQNLGERISSSLVSAFKTAASSAKEFTKTAFEQYQQLELAQISFDRLYDGNSAKLVSKIKQLAQEMPGLGAGDLAEAMKSISPIAKRNSDLALAAVQGILKGTLASGNDISDYPNMFQNIQQISSGSGTAQDTKELLRAIPALPLFIKELGLADELLDGDTLSNSKIAKYIKKNGSQALLEVFAKLGEETSAKDIYESYRKTWKGMTEELSETLINTWNNSLTRVGFYDKMSELLKKLNENGRLEKVLDKVGSKLSGFVNWIDKNEDKIFSFIDSVIDGLGQLGEGLISIVKDVATSFGVLDKNGNLDSKRLKGLLDEIISSIRSFVTGFADGVKPILGILENFTWLATPLGFMASPMGKVLSGVLGLATMRHVFSSGIGKSGSLLASGGSMLSSIPLGKIAGGLAVGGVTNALLSSWLNSNGSIELEGLINSISAAASGFMLFGPGGAAIGAAIGGLGTLVKAFIDGAEAIQENAKSNAEAVENTALTRTKESLAAKIIQEMNDMGAGIDTSTNLGKYIQENIMRYFAETPMEQWNAEDAVRRGMQAKAYKEQAYKLAELDETEAYKNAASGTVIDLTQQGGIAEEVRNNMYNMIKDYALNGDSYDYTKTPQDVLDAFLNGNNLTKEQYNLYMDAYNSAKDDAIPEIERVVESVKNDTRELIDEVDGTLYTFNEDFQYEVNTVLDGLKRYFSDPATELTDELKLLVGTDAYSDIVRERITSGQASFKEALNAALQGYAQGGEIHDPTILESHGIDTVPAMLAPGEFVMKQSAVAKFGREAMNALNHGDPTRLIRSVTSKLSNSWDYSRRSNTTNNNQQANRIYYINNQLQRRTRTPYRSFRNLLAGC